MLDDTTMGGRGDRFPTTGLSVLERLRSEERPIRAAAFDALVAIYWKPVYKYLRLRFGLSNEDAKDLTQGFFTEALVKDFIAAYDPSRARFRTFLRVCLDRFAANEAKAAGRQKRGGSLEHVPFDFAAAELEIASAASRAENPDALFEQEWVRSLFEAAVARLRQSAPSQSFALFERYDLGEEPRPTYQQLADELLIPVTTVTNQLAAARRSFRSIVLDLLREITATDEEFRDEARRLFGSKAV